MKNRRRRIGRYFQTGAAVVLLLFSMCGKVGYAEEKEEFSLYAKSAVLMDADSGRVLYSKNGAERLPMASTTKIMTCIVALENGNPEDTVTVSAYAAGQPKVHLGMTKGRQYRLGDLMYSMMLESHNDSAVAIAEHIGAGQLSLPPEEERSREESQKAVAAFAAMMNQKARDIGCFDTFFVTPNGLDATALDTQGREICHSTTARDLASIMKYCIRQSPQKEKFLEITRTSSYSFTDASGKGSYSCNNHNAFLTMMDGALSGKTGFTNAAGYCYVGALERDGKCFTVALLACGWPNHKSWKWSDTKQLMGHGLNHYTYHTFDEAEISGEWLKPVPVENGQTERIGGTASARVRLEPAQPGNGPREENEGPEGLLLGPDETIEAVCEVKKALEAPVHSGQEIGRISYKIGQETYKTVLIVTQDEVKEVDYRWCFEKLLEKFFL